MSSRDAPNDSSASRIQAHSSPVRSARFPQEIPEVGRQWRFATGKSTAEFIFLDAIGARLKPRRRSVTAKSTAKFLGRAGDSSIA
jgi:hypothetical protein